MRPFLLLPLLLPVLAACGSSPEPRYLTLAPVPGTAQPGGAGAVAIRRIGLAGYLDRSDVVVENAGYVVRIANNTRWAEPVGDMIGRVLAQDVGQRLPNAVVASEAAGLIAEPVATVQVEVQRFDRAPDGTVTLIAQVAVARRDGGSRLRALQLTTAVPAAAGGVSGDALAAGMSLLLGQCADRIAGMLAAG